MSTINIGVVYDSTTKVVKRVIVPDTDQQLNNTTWHTPSDGEGFLLVPSATSTSLSAVQSFVAANVLSL